VQSIFDSVRSNGGFSKEALAVGGDGRFMNRDAIQIIIRVAAANGFGKILVGRGGLISTPAMSALIRRQAPQAAFLLTASHNPGGPDADFGIKYNVRNGGPAPEAITERIYAKTLKIGRYYTLESPDIDIDREGTSMLGIQRSQLLILFSITRR